MLWLLRKLFGRRDRKHICAHAHVAEVYRCRCGDTYVADRR